MKKIKLSGIKVSSFVTTVASESIHMIKGGTSEDTTIRYASFGINCSLLCAVIVHKN